tara:strand:- start:2972 stop:3199 length:228 start_codon:yes stop_codon:yes gene_type:complete
MSKRLGFANPTDLEGLLKMPDKYFNAMQRTLKNAEDNKKRNVKFNIDPYTGQLRFRFNKGGVVKVKRKSAFKGVF